MIFQKFSEYFIEISRIFKDNSVFLFWKFQDFPENPKCNCQAEFWYFRILGRNEFLKEICLKINKNLVDKEGLLIIKLCYLLILLYDFLLMKLHNNLQ